MFFGILCSLSEDIHYYFNTIITFFFLIYQIDYQTLHSIYIFELNEDCWQALSHFNT